MQLPFRAVHGGPHQGRCCVQRLWVSVSPGICNFQVCFGLSAKSLEGGVSCLEIGVERLHTSKSFYSFKVYRLFMGNTRHFRRLYLLQSGALHSWRMATLWCQTLDYIKPFLANEFQNLRERLGS